jgi:hypothetical protein
MGADKFFLYVSCHTCSPVFFVALSSALSLAQDVYYSSVLYIVNVSEAMLLHAIFNIFSFRDCHTFRNIFSF